MKKILFLVDSSTLAHLVRSQLLAESLPQDQYQVFFGHCYNYNIVWRKSGIVEKRIFSISKEEFFQRVLDNKPFMDAPLMEKYLESDYTIMDEVNPDLVIGDFRFSLNISCRVKKIPFLNITNAYWSPLVPKPHVVPEHPLVAYLGQTIMELLAIVVAPLWSKKLMSSINFQRKRVNLPPLPHFYDVHCSGDRNVYCDVPNFIPHDEALPDEDYIGAVCWSPDVSLPDWWPTIKHDRLIYVSMGSSGSVTRLLKTLEHWHKLPYQFVVATAGRDLSHLKIPANVKLAGFLPGDAIAAAARAVICNGGGPSSFQAFQAGKPVIAIPSNWDQQLVSKAIVSGKLGLALRPERLSFSSFKKSLHILLEDPTYTQQAQELAKKLKSYNYKQRFPAIVKEMLP